MSEQKKDMVRIDDNKISISKHGKGRDSVFQFFFSHWLSRREIFLKPTLPQISNGQGICIDLPFSVFRGIVFFKLKKR